MAAVGALTQLQLEEGVRTVVVRGVAKVTGERDDDPCAFSSQSYLALAAGESVKDAVELGRSQITLQKIENTGLPELISLPPADPAEIRFAPPRRLKAP